MKWQDLQIGQRGLHISGAELTRKIAAEVRMKSVAAEIYA